MKVIIATIAAFGILGGIAGCRTQAADLSGPPATFEDILKMRAANPLAGCYLEAAGSGTFLAQGDRVATPSVGFGCAAKVSSVLLAGGGFRQEFGNPVNAGEIYGRLGFKLNPHVDLYGWGSWRATNWSLANTGQAYIGLGAETTIFSDNVSAFVEAGTSVAKMGRNVDTDDLRTMIGIRYWIK